MLTTKNFAFTDKNDWTNWITFTIWLLCIAGAGYYFFAFLYITSARIQYPFALEWMEGTSLVQVQRILSGELLYVRPSLEYVPLIYPPVYYYISAALTKLLGFGFFPLRLVSLFASIGSIALIYLIVRMRTNFILPALISAGFFAATFKLSGAWFDIARVDMLALFFILLAVFLASHGNFPSLFFSGIFITLACLTKQTYFIILITFCLYLLFFQRQKFLIAALPALFTYGLTFIFLNSLHDGWYKFFVYEIPAGHSLFDGIDGTLSSLKVFWIDSIVKPTPLLFIFPAIYLWHILRDFKNSFKSDIFFLPTMTAATVVLSWMALANPGSYLNVLVPVYAMLAIMVGLGLDKLLSLNKRTYTSGILGLLCLLQFIFIYYPISPQIPTQENLEAGTYLLNKIKDQPGDVYVPFHPELSLFAGRPAFASWIALLELSGGFGGETRDEWRQVNRELVQVYKKNGFTLIILDLDQFFGHPELYYSSSDIKFLDENTFHPVTGAQFQPIIMYYK